MWMRCGLVRSTTLRFAATRHEQPDGEGSFAGQNGSWIQGTRWPTKPGDHQKGAGDPSQALNQPIHRLHGNEVRYLHSSRNRWNCRFLPRGSPKRRRRCPNP
jgi:hypothetical protein